jgi:hypothetical protein
MWDEAKAIQKEPNTLYRKYKQSAHMAYLENTISQATQPGVVTFWLPTIREEMKRMQENGESELDMWIVSSFSSLLNVIEF